MVDTRESTGVSAAPPASAATPSSAVPATTPELRTPTAPATAEPAVKVEETQASQDVDLEQLKKQHKNACERAKKLATKMGGADVTCPMRCTTSNLFFK